MGRIFYMIVGALLIVGATFAYEAYVRPKATAEYQFIQTAARSAKYEGGDYRLYSSGMLISPDFKMIHDCTGIVENKGGSYIVARCYPLDVVHSEGFDLTRTVTVPAYRSFYLENILMPEEAFWQLNAETGQIQFCARRELKLGWDINCVKPEMQTAIK